MHDLWAFDAIRDPAYHRHIAFIASDRRMERSLGRPLEPHETLSKFRGPQLAIIKRIERATAASAGEVLTIRLARQAGKNELEAFAQARALSIFSRQPGKVWLRMAPTADPQLGVSMRRLERVIACDPLVKGKVRKRGSVFELGFAAVQFLSAGKQAHVLGATASIALSLDEAHKVDAGKFEEEISPFTASTNAPVLMWGVAADKRDLLYEYHERNRGTDRAIEFPAPVWCEASPAYAAHYQARREKLGENHPVIKTQYDLVDIDSHGAYLSAAQVATLFSGDHPRMAGPRAGYRYAIVVDLAGQAEREVADAHLEASEGDPDSTMAWILEYSPNDSKGPYPLIRVVDGVWWTGKPHSQAGEDLVGWAKHWRVTGGCVDARGVGEAVAFVLNRAIPAVEAYKASDQSVSEDCYDLLARLNAGRIQFWRSDPAADPLQRELQAQARHTRYEIAGHDKMSLVKPTGTGSSGLHIDGIKALTYIHRAIVRPPGSGVFDMYAAAAQRLRGGAR